MKGEQRLYTEKLPNGKYRYSLRYKDPLYHALRQLKVGRAITMLNWNYTQSFRLSLILTQVISLLGNAQNYTSWIEEELSGSKLSYAT